MKRTVPPIEPPAFKAIMRNLASSVAVITTAYNGQLHGMTATAVCSVCAEPATILIVVNRTATTHPLIEGSGLFAVNILSGNQQPIADLFASKKPEKFSGVSFSQNNGGSPILDNASAFLECVVASQVEIGTHTVFVANVISGGTSNAPPLLYHDGSYAVLVK